MDDQENRPPAQIPTENRHYHYHYYYDEYYNGGCLFFFVVFGIAAAILIPLIADNQFSTWLPYLKIAGLIIALYLAVRVLIVILSSIFHIGVSVDRLFVASLHKIWSAITRLVRR